MSEETTPETRSVRYLKLKSGQGVKVLPLPQIREEAWRMIPVALQQISIEPTDGKTFQREIEFLSAIGKSICVWVEAGDEDKVFYAKRKGQRGLSRFIKREEPYLSKFLTVTLTRVKGRIVLIGAYVGEMVPPEPWHQAATPDSASFWNSHALIWGEIKADPDTIQAECPWKSKHLRP